jgi:hypothetical protein
MRIPQQVTERVKEAPAQALRAVFSGIGQVLLVADRIKSRAAEPTRAQPGATERRGQSGQKAAAGPKDETRWRSLDTTGNVRLLSEEDAPEPAAGAEATAGDAAATAVAGTPAVAEPPADTAAPAETTAPAETAAPPAETTAPAETAAPPAETAAPAVAEVPADAEPPAASTPLAVLPVPNYDGLSVASLRARLRNLDAAQVRALLDYEKANAGRADVLTMFERRIAKLESQET